MTQGKRAASGGGPEGQGPAGPLGMDGTVLVVDDEPAVRFTLRSILEENRLAVIEAADGARALELMAGPTPIDLVISDFRMPGMDGLALIRALAANTASPRVVMITAYGSERLAVDAMKLGALDYFKKPFDAQEIVRVVSRSLSAVKLADENRRLRARLALSRVMVFESESMSRVAEVVERVAPRDVTVLITGESGTGKELVARAIVEASRRARAPFVCFNCAAIARDLAEAELFGHTRGAFTGAGGERRGLFREADGGSILLDEVDALEPATQGSLLRVLQDGEVRPVGQDRASHVDVRLIAATNKDLAAHPGFRTDLFYRLNVVVLKLPPLRERREDIAPLALHFARRYGERFGLGDARITPRLMARLEEAPWPGNVRELENTIERISAMSDGPVLDVEQLDAQAAEPGAGLHLRARMEAFERRLIAETLARCHGNQSECARQLQLSRVTLISKLRKHGLR